MQIKNLMRSLFTATLTIFLNGVTFASVQDVNLPPEVLVLKLSGNEAKRWSPICRLAVASEAVVEYIPSYQSLAIWEDLIAIQYFDYSKKQMDSLDDFLDRLKKSMIAKYAGSKLTWNIIKKKPNEVIYEWILHSQCGKIPPQHEISRIFYHKRGIHRIGYTHKNETIGSDDRDKWIQRLSDASFISQADAAFPSEEISLIVRLADLVDCSANFKDWKLVNNLTLKNNVHSFTIIPPEHNENEVTECIDLTIVPRIRPDNSLTTNLVLQSEKEQIKRKLGIDPKIQILEKTSTELVYTFQYPREHLIVTEVVRIRVTPQVYLSINYKKALPHALSQEEILAKKKHIDTIKYTANADVY